MNRYFSTIIYIIFNYDNIIRTRCWKPRPNDVRPFLSSQFITRCLYLENHLISSLNYYYKRMETPENGYLDSSRLV
jgi:hypothetical protein